MRKTITACVVLSTMIALCSASHAQVTVGSEDFESYAVGEWTMTNAPANLEPYGIFGHPVAVTGYQSVAIIDLGATQELQAEINLTNQYNVGVNIDLPMTGNSSYDMNDYVLEFYFKVDPSTWDSLGDTGLGVSIFNPDDPTQGMDVSVGSQSNYNYAVTNGAVLSIPLTAANGNAYKSYNKDFPVDASIPVWELAFGFGLGAAGPGKVDQPITYILDDIVVKYVEPPLYNPEGNPVGYQTTNDLTVSAFVLDGTLETSAMELHLDGHMVETNFVAVSGTNMISYDAVDLGPGFHTGAVKAIDNSATTNAYTVWYEWQFYVAGEAEAPSEIAIASYNINFALSTHGNSYGFYPVTNGTVAAAPPVGGSNTWANINYPNVWWLGGWTPKQISEASGEGVFGDIYHEGEEAGLQMYAPKTWESYAWGAPNEGTIWAGAMGAPNCNMNFQLRNLDSSFTYDLYLYFTDPMNAAEATTTYTITKGYAPDLSATLLSSQAAVAGGVQDTNYVAITQISPLGGEIRFNVLGGATGGGLSALQLVVRRPDASVVPNIQSISNGGGMVNLTWDSQPYISYDIMAKSSLGEDTWMPVTNAVPGAGESTSVSVQELPGAGFYKVEAY